MSLPKRMAAGGALRFLEPLRVGAALERRSWIGDVAVKEGRSGPLVFVHVRHEVRQDSALALSEDQHIVYCGPGAAGESPPRRPRSGPTPSWMRTIRPDAALLFRYSALTYNGHRIHYDRRYATEEEGYAGLVVYGPLVATYLLDLCLRNRPGNSVAEFAYRPIRPLFEDEPIVLAGQPDESGETSELWALGPAGEVAIRASARFGAAGTGPDWRGADTGESGERTCGDRCFRRYLGEIVVGRNRVAAICRPSESGLSDSIRAGSRR